MTDNVVYLNNWPRELPPLVTTTPPARRDTPTAVCVSLIDRGYGEQPCDGLLAYLRGRWQHVDACHDCLTGPTTCAVGHLRCDTPQPRECTHGCGEAADVEMPCTGGGVGDCDGCCWVTDDALQGRRLWRK